MVHNNDCALCILFKYWILRYNTIRFTFLMRTAHHRWIFPFDKQIGGLEKWNGLTVHESLRVWEECQIRKMKKTMSAIGLMWCFDSESGPVRVLFISLCIWHFNFCIGHFIPYHLPHILYINVCARMHNPNGQFGTGDSKQQQNWLKLTEQDAIR